MLRTLLLIAAVALSASGIAARAVPDAGCYDWHGQTPLQRAVDANSCVTVRPGTYIITGSAKIPGGHVLAGLPGRRADTILRAAPGPYSGVSGLLEARQGGGPTVTIADLTIDAAHRAYIGIAGGGLTLRRLTVAHVICDGITVDGPGDRVEDSTLEDNGPGSECPNAPPGAGIYVEVPGTTTGVASYNPVISGNTFIHNGVGLDVNHVGGGAFTHNTLVGNDGWAGVSLYGAARWTIAHNTIRQPSRASRGDRPGGNVSYQSSCQYGPGGGHPAAIFLCENSDLNNGVTIDNTIEDNAASSYYGILLIGAARVRPYLVPRFNVLRGNNVYGSVVGCADAFRPGQWPDGRNTWAGNNCAGKPNTGPAYF